MHQYSKYLISKTDHFDPDYFSSVSEEVDAINERVEYNSAIFRVEMIISFLKDHSLKKEWVEANPALADKINSGALFTGKIESLFESCRNNPDFMQQLEIYLTKRFSGKSTEPEQLPKD